jgi:hypothetical protein
MLIAMYSKFIPIFAVKSFVLFSFTGVYLNLEIDIFIKYRITAELLRKQSGLPGGLPIEFYGHIPFLLQNPQWNQRMNSHEPCI